MDRACWLVLPAGIHREDSRPQGVLSRKFDLPSRHERKGGRIARPTLLKIRDSQNAGLPRRPRIPYQARQSSCCSSPEQKKNTSEADGTRDKFQLAEAKLFTAETSVKP